MNALVRLGLGVATLAAWLASRGHRDPRVWPQTVTHEAARLRVQVAEAVAAGRRAAKEQEEALEKSLADADAQGDRSA